MTSFNRIIVLGDQKLGKEVKEALINFGFDPILVEVDLLEEKSKGSFRPLSLKGGVGSFTLLLSGDTGYFEEKGAFVVLCLSPVYAKEFTNPKFSMSFKEFLDWEPEGVKEIAILDPSNGRALPSVWSSVMDKLLSMDLSKIKVRVVASQIKVAGEGLERKYRMLREQGVVFYKPEDVTYSYDNGNVIKFRDHIIGKEIELKPQLLVTLDQPVVPQAYRSLFETLRIEVDEYNYPQDDNILRYPYYTNRKGVFVISPLPEFLTEESINQLVSGLCIEFKRLSNEIKGNPSKATIEYNQGQCAYCLTCFRVCPHGAILFESKPNFLPFACEECGICVANCPGEALKLIGLKYEALLEEVKESIGKGLSKVVLACKRNYAAVSELLDTKLDPSRDIAILLEIPCAGYVNENLLLRMAGMGSLKNIVVVGCKEGNCKTGTGTLRGERACEYVKKVLKSLGIEVPMLNFFRLSSQDHIGLGELVREL